ncbi:MAG: rhomboid family intramembrane serine protease [Polyangiaceae bacterium]|nr:rhomboid family intramembrane serine protease [Polyangiaceae bacterium]MCB9607068.1 rhomboid family intramembrane serine protease [Polyangiaceae bacterium]
MSRPSGDGMQVSGGLQMPGKALKGVLLALLAVNVAFAVAINYGGASAELFYALCGSTEKILHGQVWRLVTAPWMHEPSGNIGHLLFALIGLFFLTPQLETQWGTKRTLRFLFFAGLIAYTIQGVLELALPAQFSARLVPAYWYGAAPVIEAVAVAWALSFRGQTVRLFFVLPVTSGMLLGFVIAMSVLRVLWLSAAPEGLLSPFGGMFAGWLLGGGTPSPLRRAWLRFRLRQLDAQVEKDSSNRKKRVAKSSFRVIEGGRGKDDEGKGPDGRWLN